MDVWRGLATFPIGGCHCVAQARQTLPAGNGAEQQTTGFQDQVKRSGGERQVIGRVQQSDGDAEIELLRFEREAFKVSALPTGTVGHQRPWIDDADVPRLQAPRPVRVGATGQQHVIELALDVAKSLQAVVECAVVEKRLGSYPNRAVASHGAELVIVKRSGHGPLVRCPARSDKSAMQAMFVPVTTAAKWIVDLALPARCPGCGTITAEIQSFCTDCWRGIEWLGDSGCSSCGLPLAATEIDSCAACLAKPPIIARTRAAVAYGDTTRTLPLRLKYSRKIALAKTMARYMQPLLDRSGEPLLVPVPLHRSRLWSRGFNQAALLARDLARRCDIAHDPFALRRTKRTLPLKQMSPQQRRRQVAGAFQTADPATVAGRRIILVDDVLTTGSTAEACAKALRRVGASRVELICWARVVRPAQIMR